MRMIYELKPILYSETYCHNFVINYSLIMVRRRGVADKDPAFQPGGPGSIPGGVRNFNFYSGPGCVSFVSVLSCVVSGGGPDIVLTHLQCGPRSMSCVLVQRLLLSLQASDPRAFGL